MSAMNRVSTLVGHVQPSVGSTSSVAAAPTANALGKVGVKRDDDVVIVSALRTAIGRARRGAFKNTYVEELLAPVLKATLERTKVDPKSLGDIVVGSVLGVGTQRANECRIASFLAGIPEEVPVHILNRQCSSGLQSIASVASSIKAGYYDVGLAAGVESMSLGAFMWEGSLNPKVFLNPQAKSCLLPMGQTSENVAERYGVTRKEQDEFSVRSHKNAAAATASGRFKDEIIPVTVKVKDPKTGAETEVVVDKDEGFRADTTFEGLSKLKPAFKPGGATTAGNSSQVSDGAAAVLLMTRAKAKALGLPIKGVFRSFAAVGCDPAVMGIGPAVAIPPAVQQAGLSLNDIDLFEINEAFASQAVFSVKKLGIDVNKVNVNGGAIAIGHPLGCTGSRQTATLLSEMAKRKAKYGVVSMCIGSGMGAAAVYEYEN